MKKYVYWFLAIVITLVLSVYQRMTGPTYPKKVTIELNVGKIFPSKSYTFIVFPQSFFMMEQYQIGTVAVC